MIGQVVFAAAKDENRPMLAGVLFEFTEAALTLVATDTHRLALREFSVTNSHGAGHLLIPGRALAELRGSLAAGDDGLVRCQHDENQVQFQVEELTLASRVLAGPFPAYQKILPTECSRRLTVGRDDLLQAVRRAEIVARDDSLRVRLRANGERLEITATGASASHVREEIEVTLEGDGIEVGVNARYLLDALGALEGETLVLELTEPLRPIVLRPVEGKGNLQLIMPVSVK